MRNSRDLLLWVLVGTAGVLFLIWAFPRAFPFLPEEWSINSHEATAIALERLRDVGPPVKDPYVVTRLATDPLLERRLQLAPGERREALPRTNLAQGVLRWQVTTYEPAARTGEWKYRAWIALDGKVTGLRLRLPPDQPGEAIDPAQARIQADAFLKEQGFDLSRFQEPQARRTDLNARTDWTLRYRDREEALGPSFPYGIEVTFAGRQLAGFRAWNEEPGNKIQETFQLTNLLANGRILVPFLLVAFLAFPFLRRYHAGEVGVKRSSQLFLLIFVAGTLVIGLGARGETDGFTWGGLSRRQATWAWAAQLIIFWISAMSLTGFLGWAVGEVLCRERWGHKLAAFDALFQRAWGNATFARSALRGVLAGTILTALTVGLILLLRPLEVWSFAAMLFEPWWSNGPWPGVTLFAVCLVLGIAYEFVGRLVLVPLVSRRLGIWLGGLVAASVSAVLFWPPTVMIPLRWEFLLALVASLVLVFLFVRYDLLTSVLAAVTSAILWGAVPFLLAEDNFLNFQGALALALVATPLIVSLRHLGSGREFVYRYEDIPPHVRRIAERERQRVELETARRIQSSILPELPPRLAGVDIAHAYLPASEVGGDFYDVLALEDGRLAVAVGDVAGHGVSSGLIMSMAKSALAVQVAFNPDVAAVFNTLNRTVYQTARKRLLATLCYALLDPRRLELIYASAGHLFPYRINTAGRVEALESVAYPLGVRGELNVEARTARLAPGDTLFFFSDGLIEARREGSEDLFGFERLEQNLARHAGRSVEGLRDGILADVSRFTGDAPREDDQTILVLRLP
jgi:hypothetical protein